MKNLLIPVILFVMAGCAKNDGGAMYSHPSGLFTARAAASWRVDEAVPGDGARRVAFLASDASQIAIYEYEAGHEDYDSAEDYARVQTMRNRQTEKVKETVWKGRKAFAYGISRDWGESGVFRESGLAVEQGDGFVVVLYSAPEKTFAGGEKIFSFFLESLALKSP